jgi:hypothetical protein
VEREEETGAAKTMGMYKLARKPDRSQKGRTIMLYLDLIPAYGRDYKSQKEVKEAWLAGKDFEVATFGPEMGRVLNVSDAPKGSVMNIRFKQLRNVAVIKT